MIKLALVSLQSDAERVPPVGLICIATYLKEPGYWIKRLVKQIFYQ